MEGDNKLTWVIKNFNSYLPPPNRIYSEEFIVDRCKWRLVAYTNRHNNGKFSLYLDVPSSKSLALGWRRIATVRFTIVNQLNEALSLTAARKHRYDARASSCGFFFPLERIHGVGGFLVYNELKIVAVVDIGEARIYDVPEDLSEEANNSSTVLKNEGGAE